VAAWEENRAFFEYSRWLVCSICRWLSSGLLRDINLAHVWPSDAFCRFAQFDVRVRGACE
jgi:hypothetical protein